MPEAQSTDLPAQLREVVGFADPLGVLLEEAASRIERQELALLRIAQAADDVTVAAMRDLAREAVHAHQP